MFDQYNRASFFFILIGPYKLPVFQPGTVTLFSGVKRSCPLEVFAKNCGQNGPILGTSCALFLAKFMSHLASKYKETMTVEGKKPSTFDSEVYHNVLIEMLDLYCEEDADHHGRLVELKKLCLDINNAEKVDLTDEEEKKFMLNDYRVYKDRTDNEDKEGLEQMRERFVFYSDWEKLFFEENTTKIHEELLPKIEKELLMKKNIFPNPYSYEILESHFEILLKQLKQFDIFDQTYVRKLSKKKKLELERKQLEEFRRKKRQGKGGKGKGQNGKKRKGKDVEEREEPEEHEEEPVEEPEKEHEQEGEDDQEGEGEHQEGEEEQVEEVQEEVDPFAFVEDHIDDQRFFVKNHEYYFDYDISCNSRLSEYFNAARKGLRALYVCGKITDTIYMCPKAITTYDTVSELSTLFPIYSHILSSSGFDLSKMRDKDIRKTLNDITVFSVCYDDISYHIAKGMTIARRNELSSMAGLSNKDIDKIGSSVVKSLKNCDFSDHQIMGIVDSKYAEAASIKLITDESFNFSKQLRVRLHF